MAEEKGITEEEIGIIQAIVMAVSGGRIRAQLKEIRSRCNSVGNKKKEYRR